MKALKIVLAALGGLVLLVALALAATLVVVDGAFVKARLERAMKEKNRNLTIEGTPQLRLFPVAGIALGKASLSEPGGQKPFVALDSAEVAVRVMPLLSGAIEVEKLSVAGLKASVVKGKDGRMNFADLLGPEGQEEEARREPPKVRIAEANIERAQLSYRDDGSGQEAAVSEFHLKTGRLDGSAPGPVSMSARISGRKPDLDLRAQMAGALRFDLARQEIAFDGFTLGAKGRLDQDTLAAELAAPRVEITPSKASGAEVKGTLQLKGSRRNVNLVFRIDGIQGSARDLSLAAMALDIDAAAEGNSVKGRVSTPVKGNLQARTWELPSIAANLTLAGPAIAQKSVTLPIQASARADLGKRTAAFELSTKFDESSIQAKLAATKFAPLAASFDVAIDRLNLDRYLPAERAEAKQDDARVDLSALKGKTLSGRIAIGALTAKRVKMEKVTAEIRLAGGKLEVSPHSLGLYGGAVSGALVADANGNRISVKETMQGVNLGPLLADLAKQDRLEGRASVNLEVTTAGANVPAMKKALGGSARVELKDGAVKGFSLAESLRDVKSVLGSRSAKAGDPAKKTDFSEITASFAIRNGVARNDDLQGKAPLFRLAGAGDIDIGGNAINYLAKAAIVATAQGQGGKDLSHLAGVTVPVKLTGALDKPDWSIDYGELAAKSGVGKVVETLGGAVGGAAGGARDAVRSGIRGLFGR